MISSDCMKTMFPNTISALIDVETKCSMVKSPLAVVCHDAGATNLIIGWLKSTPGIEVRVHVQGPALALWQAAFPGSAIYSLDEALHGAVQLLSGSGWASVLEHDARILAQVRNVPTIAAVDHWVNYQQRFVRNGIEALPDEIWVSDQYAFAEANRCFPGKTVHLLPNTYLNEQVAAIKVLDSKANPRADERILYALEPIREAWFGADMRPGEFQALDYFLSRLDTLGLSKSTQIRLRPHPSDPPGKYESWLESKTGYDVMMAPVEPLAEAIAWADWVAGCESFVLIIALAARRKVVSTLPPWAYSCRLPHEGIIRLRDL